MNSLEDQNEVISECYGKHFDFDRLVNFCEQNYRSARYRGVIHLDIEPGDVYIFDYATIVYWGVSHQKRAQIADEISAYVQVPRRTLVKDKLTFNHGEHFSLQNNHLTLDNPSALAKLAVSHTFAQSVKLEVFEEQVEQTIRETAPIPKYLAEHGKIKLSRNQIARMRGNLYLTKSSVNLHYELLDKPDFFWEYPELDHYYLKTEEYQEISIRLEILNKKLEVIQELLNILADELNHKHSAVLEWIIIWLIAVEIAIFFVHDFFKWI